ncbi:MAG: hypothetical protein H7123_09625, partial [Thermoleophilia bacterium]|nr:hypothetical protein [Thermoleophilia bacterium]
TSAADAAHGAGTSPVAFVPMPVISLSLTHSARKVTFSGAMTSPKAPGKYLIIQRQTGPTTWVKVATTKLTAKSTYKFTKSFAAGSYTFRAYFAGNKYYWPGGSVARKVTLT